MPRGNPGQSRRRRGSVIAAQAKVEPTIADQVRETLTGLDERARRLAARARLRKNLAISLKADEYEKILSMAERYDEDAAVVLRACMRLGMAHYERWANDRPGQSPFAVGALDGFRRPAEVDPTGNGFAVRGREGFAPPPPVEQWRGRPTGRTIYRDRVDDERERAREGVETTIIDTIDSEFSPPRRDALAGLLPNGATEQINAPAREHEPPPERPFAPPEIDDEPPAAVEQPRVGPQAAQALIEEAARAVVPKTEEAWQEQMERAFTPQTTSTAQSGDVTLGMPADAQVPSVAAERKRRTRKAKPEQEEPAPPAADPNDPDDLSEFL
jgi:predicted  nucleic acid-binding Zn-ribbon protein